MMWTGMLALGIATFAMLWAAIEMVERLGGGAS